MSNFNREPEGLVSDERQGRALTIVPAIPHVDQNIDTAPPWTVPISPDYGVDPHLDIPPTSTHREGDLRPSA